MRSLEEAAARILDLYRGHFLTGDAEQPWHIPLRNRLSGRFARFVLRVAAHWESGNQWSSAAELYQRGIELDPLAESFYRGRMVCLSAQGRRAEAIEVFRQCRHALSIMLGIAPSAETDAVYRSLLAS
jgi:DNA-binding SARP family transcriptional activator